MIRSRAQSDLAYNRIYKKPRCRQIRDFPGKAIISSTVDGKKTVIATYRIAAKFCSPTVQAGGFETLVLLATHGLICDGR